MTKYAADGSRGAQGERRGQRRSGVALKLLRKLHQTIAKITQDFEGRWHFNTCVAAIMELVNELQGGRCATGGRSSSRAGDA